MGSRSLLDESFEVAFEALRTRALAGSLLPPAPLN